MQKTLELVNGRQRAVFVKEKGGWRPDWFYLDDRPMLRFKDHEWLSIGHVRPRYASSVDSRGLPLCLAFNGHTRYGRTRVPWSVSLTWSVGGRGFQVTVSFRPEADIELLEAYTTFETPYEYDGTETMTAVLGMNPVVRYVGGERKSPPIWENPAWCYSRPQAARITGPCSAPFLCQALTTGAAAGRYVTVYASDWDRSRVHDVYVTPTRKAGEGEAAAGVIPGRYGYKYIVGALNWSSAYAKDPNVIFARGEMHDQHVAVNYADTLPGGSMDAFVYDAWWRTLAVHLPPDGRVAAFDRARKRGVTWQTATIWLRDVFCGQGVEGLYLKGKGICTYAVGSRPKAGGDYGWFWWPQWAGGFHYRALLTGDRALARTCDRLDAEYAKWVSGRKLTSNAIAMGVVILPGIWWMYRNGRDCTLARALAKPIAAAVAESAAENGKPRQMDFGSQAANAEAFLLGSAIYGRPAFRDQALTLLAECNAQLDGDFWAFNMGQRGNLMHGGQVRPLGHGHAVVANLLAWQMTKKPAYLTAAHRFARYLAAICYATHNGSKDPDFDWRGWANGSNAGRDQIAEFPPWETQNGLLCLAALMDTVPLEPGFYGLLWYIGRTGLAQFPAARTLKRVLDEGMQPHYLPRRGIASERDFYDCLPYLAYENPHDQTLLASYQGTDCLLGDLVYGGGLAAADDPRLGVFVPGAALFDPALADKRVIHLWNPQGADVITTRVTTTWPDGSRTSRRVTVPPAATSASCGLRKLVLTR